MLVGVSVVCVCVCVCVWALDGLSDCVLSPCRQSMSLRSQQQTKRDRERERERQREREREPECRPQATVDVENRESTVGTALFIRPDHISHNQVNVSHTTHHPDSDKHRS